MGHHELHAEISWRTDEKCTVLIVIFLGKRVFEIQGTWDITKEARREICYEQE
jgi:hypothetical protein